MAKREDQGKNLLRLLQAAQPAPAPPNAPLHPHHSETENLSDYPPPCPLAAAEVRSAAAGEQHYCYEEGAVTAAAASPTVGDLSPYGLPRPGASPNTPARSAGADLLGTSRQSPHLAAEPATTRSQHRQSQQYQKRQQQHPPHHRQLQQHQPQQKSSTSPPPPSTPRSDSIAAEQERFLKKFLAIGGDTGDINNTSLPISPPRQQQQQQQRTALVPMTPPPPGPPPPAVPPAGITENSKSPRTHKSRHTNNQGRGRGVGGREGRGRGARTPQHATGGRDARKGRGRGGGGGGGGRGGPAAPTPPQAYAWSAFQNSPDPKSIPIPSLQHFNLDTSPSGGEESTGPETGPSPLNWREMQQQQQQQPSITDAGGGGDDDPAIYGTGLSTPPPAAARVARITEAERGSRSSAKKAEDDIKRMLRLG